MIFATFNRSQSTSRSPWSEEEEDELQRLHQEFKDVQDAGENRFSFSPLLPLLYSSDTIRLLVSVQEISCDHVSYPHLENIQLVLRGEKKSLFRAEEDFQLTGAY